MRWLKLLLIIAVIVGGGYALSMTYVEKVKEFSITKELNYPIDKVYGQFDNLQNYTTWNEFIPKNEGLSFSYFTPYQGIGAAMHYMNKKDSTVSGDLFIRNAVVNKKIQYSLYHGKDTDPYKILINFQALKDGKTKITWKVRTPQRSFLKRPLNLFSEDHFNANLDESLASLNRILGMKVDKEIKLKNIQYGVITMETHGVGNLVGLNETVSNRKEGDWYNSIVMNYNKLFVFLTRDLHRKEDEFGDVELITVNTNPYSKEISYYLGARVVGKFDLPDRNFVFKTSEAGKFLVSYYTGSYGAGKQTVLGLLKRAKEMKLEAGRLVEIFVEPPLEDREVIIKYMLEVHPLPVSTPEP